MRLNSILIASLLAIPATAQNPQIQRELGVGTHNTAGGKNTPTAVTPAISLFGQPCASACGALNDTGGTQRAGTLPNEYGYAYKPAAAQTMIGFSLWTNATTTNLIEVVDCAVYREDTTTAGQPGATAVATGKIGVQGGATGWYHVILSAPVSIAANETIWISQLNTSAILASAKTAGTAPPARTFWRRTGTTWSPTGIINFPVYRVLCSGSLANSSDLKINTTANVDLVGGPANFPAGLVLGATNPALPFGCGTLYAQPLVVLNGQIGGNGTLSIPLPIPNNPALDGAPLYMQYWHITASGALNATNGILAQVGM